MQVRRLFYGVKGAARLAKYASLWEHAMTDEAKRRITISSPSGRSTGCKPPWMPLAQNAASVCATADRHLPLPTPIRPDRQWLGVYEAHSCLRAIHRQG